MKKNFISIIIPYHRKKKYFQETIKSILNQTYKYYELIVDEANKKRVNELCSLKEEAIIKGDTTKVVEVDSELNTLVKGGVYVS